MKYVRIVIRLDGSCTVDAMNFTDAGCKQVTGAITDALGGCVVNDRTKPEARIARRTSAAERESV